MKAGAIPSAINHARRLGWNMLQVRQPGRRRGGVALLVREPFALKSIAQHASEKGQWLFADLLGGDQSVTVGVAYRPPDNHLQFLYDLLGVVHSFNHRNWILALDGNCSQLPGVFAESLLAFGAKTAVVARHSSEPIDAVWVSKGLDFYSSHERVWEGDHSLAETCVSLKFRRQGPVFRFARAPRQMVPEPNLERLTTAWQTQDAEQDLEEAWHAWHTQAENWLRQNGHIQNTRAQAQLGSTPKLRHGPHAAATGQHANERNIRWHVRRLKEALVVSRQGRSVPLGLVRYLVSSNIPPLEREAAGQEQWGLALQLAEARLEEFLQAKHKGHLQAWRDRVHTVHGAASWCNMKTPPPVALTSADGEHVWTTRTQAATALYDTWTKIFGNLHELPLEHTQFLHKYQRFIRPSVSPPPELADISAQDLIGQLRRMRAKAAGPHGWTAGLLLQLPQAALTQLAELLNRCEQQAWWPEGQRHWRCVFLPKNKQGFAKTTEVGPIAIASIIYRCWSGIRFRQCSTFLAGCLDSHQAGGVKGPDCETLLLDLDMVFSSEDYSFMVCLDFQKSIRFH